MDVIFHIGWSKTGTTAFQNWLMSNESALRDTGVLYPETGRCHDGAHNILGMALRPIRLYSLRLEPKDVWGKLVREIEAKKKERIYHTVIVSSECMPPLYQYREYLEMLEPLCSGMAVLAVVREQVAILRSLFAQHIKDPEIHATHTMMELFEHQKTRFLYHEVLEEYRRSYPWKWIKALPYGPEAPGELIREIGAEPEPAPLGARNASPSAEAVEVLRRLNQIHLPLRVRKRINEKVLRVPSFDKLRSPDLTDEETKIIRNYYALSNERLAQDYGVDLRDEANA